MANILLVVAFFSVICITHTGGTKCLNTTSENTSEHLQAAFINTLLDNAKNLLEDAKFYAGLKTSCSMPIDCAEILEANPAAQSEIYKIWPRSRAFKGFIEAYCDMDDEGGGWTVIQRRGDFDSGIEFFYQNWDAYKKGFGYFHKDFWLGNKYIFALTNQRLNTVKIVLSDWEGNTTYATYNDFWIEDEIRNYTLHVRGYSGTAGDSFSYHDGAPFTTKDRDNDSYSDNCANLYFGAWWFKYCHISHLNGKYMKGTHTVSSDSGVYWSRFRGSHYSLKDTVIKIRPKHYKEKIQDITPH